MNCRSLPWYVAVYLQFDSWERCTTVRPNAPFIYDGSLGENYKFRTEGRKRCCLLFYLTSFILQEGDFFHKFNLNLRKKLIKYYIWNIAFYGDKSCTLR